MKTGREILKYIDELLERKNAGEELERYVADNPAHIQLYIEIQQVKIDKCVLAMSYLLSKNNQE